jgi:hypothetical protein
VRGLPGSHTSHYLTLAGVSAETVAAKGLNLGWHFSQGAPTKSALVKARVAPRAESNPLDCVVGVSLTAERNARVRRFNGAQR